MEEAMQEKIKSGLPILLPVVDHDSAVDRD
jgi:hypothetical protein